jgi:NitT/TauT family transport system substrate-binding protein
MRARRLIVPAALFALFLLPQRGLAQPLKKVRMALPTTSISFLALHAAVEKGFFRQEGIELELILMQAALASTAVLTGDIDYNGAVTGVIGAAVQGRPVKVLIFTVARPLEFLLSRKDIKEPRQLKGKKIAGSSPGGTVTMLAKLVLRHYGLDPDRDVSLNPFGGTGAGRLAALESGVVDASILEVPENIIAMERGFNELVFFGDLTEFPQNGFGTSEKKIRENPDEIFKMVRATLRGLRFIREKNNRDEALSLIMKQWKVRERKMAAEMFRHLERVLTRDAVVKNESIQFLIDLARENAKVTKAVSAADVVDYSFVEKARKELGAAHWADAPR